MINNRDNFRLHQFMDVSWSVPEQRIAGDGKIFNISLSGMQFETDQLFKPEHGMTIGFSAAEIPAFPAKGKLVWFKEVGKDKKHYQCGIRFSRDSMINHLWIQWMEANIEKLGSIGDSKILSRYLTSEE